MKILAFEFSSPQRSVATVRAGNRAGSFVAAEAIESGPARGALGVVDELLREAGLAREQIDALAIGLGPGSYTGIRNAIAFAQGWQLARDVKLLGVSSAGCIAEQARADGWSGRATVVIDAQREEFYVATYELAETAREVEPLRLTTLAEVRRREQNGDVLIGPEATRWAASGRIVFPRATTLGRLALAGEHLVDGGKLEPIYLRETAFVKAPPPRFSA